MVMIVDLNAMQRRPGMARCCLQIIGHLLVPSVLYGGIHPAPSDTIHLVLWLPTFLGLTIRLLNSRWRISINCIEYAKRAWRSNVCALRRSAGNDVERVEPQSLVWRHQLQCQVEPAFGAPGHC
jgi:hypothetical protein